MIMKSVKHVLYEHLEKFRGTDDLEDEGRPEGSADYCTQRGV